MFYEPLLNTFQNPFDRGLLKITHFLICYSFLNMLLISCFVTHFSFLWMGVVLETNSRYNNIKTQCHVNINMKVIYRISDGGYSKIKPEFVTKRGVFLHFLKIFEGHDIYVIADNVSDDTYDFLCNNANRDKIFKTKFFSNYAIASKVRDIT